LASNRIVPCMRIDLGLGTRLAPKNTWRHAPARIGSQTGVRRITSARSEANRTIIQ
jgi:hypothetical protein